MGNILTAGAETVRFGNTRSGIVPTFKVRNATEIASTLRDLGVDPETVLRQQGIQPELFSNPENVLLYAALGRLAAACVAATGCDDFGLQVGARSAPTVMGLTGLVSMNSPTVRDGIGVILTTLRTSDTGGDAFLEVHDGVASFGYRVVAPAIEAREQIEDASIAIIVNVMRHFLGRQWRPLRARFARAPPRDKRRFVTFFGAPLRFGERQTCVEFDASTLETTIGNRDPAYADILKPLLEEAARQTAPDFLAVVRSIIRTEVAGGTLSRDRLCQALRLTARTLNNRLNAHGETYSTLADQMRYEAAPDLLLRHQPISDIAVSLGFADQSAFTRAFKNWSGAPPARWLMDRSHASLM